MESLFYIPILLLAVAIPFLGIVFHNHLTAARNRTREAWAALDAALRARHDFVADLAEVAGPRERCRANRGPISTRARDEREFVAAMRTAIATRPELLAPLGPIEDAIRSASQDYDAAAKNYRRRCETFPHSILAALSGFQSPALFEVELVSDSPAL
ncbi:MAG TPA: LemA family protein [Chthoniobacterales bacterium]|jgi:hypothetical protein